MIPVRESIEDKLYVDGKEYIRRTRQGSEFGDGYEYTPEDESNWWTSYIVTDSGKLLSWDLNGKYYDVTDRCDWEVK